MLTREGKDDFNGLIIDGVQTYEEDLETKDLCVTGTALLLEDLEAETVDVPGSLEVRGLLTCDDLSVSGRCKAGYGVIIEQGKISGSLKTSGKINAESMVVSGKLNSRSGIKVYDLDVKGELSCLNLLKCEQIDVTGSLWVDGKIDTATLFIDSGVKSYADEIYADEIIVRKNQKVVADDEYLDYLLKATDIDCNIAELAYTRIGTLACIRAEIGPGCVVDEVYCKREVTISPHATVGKVVYI
ncbi:MAG: hypothetical protein E7388_04465 [Ruminococcaceae bacterium]|nr:hypothetical protein [Oscillospiraceae bacterium]